MPKSVSPLSGLSPRKVCLLKPSALGDIVQTLPVLTMLRARWPESHLAWVVNRGLAGVLDNHPDLDECIPFDRTPGGWRTAGRLWRLGKRLREGKFDLVIDFQGLMRTGLMALASGSPKRVGMSNAREGATWAYTDRVEIPTRDMPALEKYRRVAEALGCMGEPPPARLGIGFAEREFARLALQDLPRPIVTIHPGAQWETKRWPPAHFAELARRAQLEFGAGIVLVGGPGEHTLCKSVAHAVHADEPSAAALQTAGNFLNLAERTSLLQLAAVIESSAVFLSGDTGPMHLAAAVGTPVVSLFTCTSPLRAGPRGNASRIVATQVPCASSYLKRCRSMICMQELTPARVWPVLQSTLASTLYSTN